MTDGLMSLDKIGLNYNPLKETNKIFADNMGKVAMQGGQNPFNDFDKILNKQIDSVNSEVFDAGIQMNVGLNATDSASMQFQQNNNSLSPVDNVLGSFKNAISGGLNTVNANQTAANTAIETFASGGDIDLHDVMIAAQKSSLSMQMALQLRNKMLAFYNEISQIRI